MVVQRCCPCSGSNPNRSSIARPDLHPSDPRLRRPPGWFPRSHGAAAAAAAAAPMPCRRGSRSASAASITASLSGSSASAAAVSTRSSPPTPALSSQALSTARNRRGEVVAVTRSILRRSPSTTARNKIPDRWKPEQKGETQGERIRSRRVEFCRHPQHCTHFTWPTVFKQRYHPNADVCGGGMVSRAEEEQVNRLEKQAEDGGGGEWEYLSLVRKLKLRRPDKVLKHGFSIINDPKRRSALGPEEWTLYEQVAIAAMDCQCLDLAKECIWTLQRKFPQSKRVGRLEAMLLEAKGLWEEAERAYQSLLEDNQFDQVIHKRRVAIAKAQGNLSGAIEWLNKYLEIFMADHDAWRELAEIYVSLQMFKQAAFCYEELILSQPTIPLYHLAYADVLYTLGGLENVHAAKKYYAATIDLTGGKNIRALFGVCLCVSAIGQLTKGRNKDNDKESAELQSLSALALEKVYSKLSPAKLSLLNSTLRSLKVSL